MADTTTKQPFSFPQFNMPGFPYASLPDQLAASFLPPGGQFTNGSQYGRWNGVNNNAFGLFPNQFQPLFGTTPGGSGMAFQPPWGNNGTLGSNQGPGSNPGMTPPPNTPPPPSGGAGQPSQPGGGFDVGVPPPNNTPFPPFNVPPMAPGSNPFGSPPTIFPSGLPPFNAPSSQAPGSNTTPLPGSGVTPFPINSGLNPINKIAPGVTFSGGNQAAPSIPTGGQMDNTAYSSRFMPTGANVQSAELQHALASGRLQGPFAQQLASLPQSFTPAQFNQVAQQNPVLAEQMAAQGDQSYRNAIMAQNGWTNGQMNNFINAYGSSATPGFNPQAMQLLNSLGIR